MMTIETDLLMMSLCIFAPSLFALILLFFPKGSDEYMRWFTLLGTAITFVLTGSERAFAAGADIKEMAEATYGRMAGDTRRLQASFTAVAKIGKPALAVVASRELTPRQDVQRLRKNKRRSEQRKFKLAA